MAATVSSCPTCDHLLGIGSLFEASTTLESSTTERSGAQTAIDPMLKEVGRLDKVILVLNQERAQYLREINATQSTTRKLPVEVLSRIFRYARPPIDFSTRRLPSSWPTENLNGREYFPEDDFQLTLGAVSHHWRKVVLSTPQLWTSLSIEVAEPYIESVTSLLDLYFQHAQALPVTVELDCRMQLQTLLGCESEERNEILSIMEPLKYSLFTNHAHKVHELILTGLLPNWILLIDHNFSRCQRVTFRWPENVKSKCTLSLAQLPSLRHVRMTSFVPFCLPQGLTDLELTEMPTRVYVEALIACPALVRLKVYSNPFARYVDRSAPTLTQTIVHEHLQNLEWFDNSASSGWARAFLAYFRFSRLEELSWIGDATTLEPDQRDTEDPALDNHRSFFSKLPSSLRVLRLYAEGQITYSFLYLKSMFGGLPHLEYLHLDGFEALTTTQVLGMIGYPLAALTSGDNWPNSPIVDASITDGPRVLVEMKTMVVECSNMFLLEKRLVRMLQSLHASRGTASSFVLELSNPIAWGEEAVKRLKSLLENRFDFVIKEDGEMLDLAVFHPSGEERFSPVPWNPFVPDDVTSAPLTGRW